VLHLKAMEETKAEVARFSPVGYVPFGRVVMLTLEREVGI
jgi:hypothetical protein